MRGRERKPIAVTALVCVALLVGLGAGGCGSSDSAPEFSDAKIIDQLHLEKSDGAYAIHGDPFCEVSKQLLNTSDEIQSAEAKDKLGLVITSGGDNVGIEGVAPFAPDCEKSAKKKLSKLDPKPKPKPD